jgi:hypothetical protein
MYLPFVEAFFEVLPNFGFKEIKRGQLSLKDKLVSEMNVTALIGLSKDVRGNVAYGMGETTAQNVASCMMGFPVEEFDEMAKSAVAELANMLASRAAIPTDGGGALAPFRFYLSIAARRSGVLGSHPERRRRFSIRYFNEWLPGLEGWG